jgi:nucleotidyltransferase/DNA polymerase involved in DNA repair
MGGPITICRWPRAVAHVDADAFFASVEQALHPELRGRPVITGLERGIVAAASYEAKRRGIKRGVPVHQVRRICPECALVPSDYETYSLFSKRMFSVMRRFSPQVEEYSIDEGFIDLTGLRRLHHTDYRGIAAEIQAAIQRELGITASIGVSLSKSLAKLCSKFRKPQGLTAVPGRHIHLLLKRTALEEVWGFGPNTVALLEKRGLKNALDFVTRPQRFASRLMGKVGRELWAELRGEYIYKISTESQRQVSISKFKTFTPPSGERGYVWARALRNLESAAIKARRHGLAARRLILVLRTQQFDTWGLEAKLSRPTAATNELTSPLAQLFDKLHRPGVLYRSTGVVLGHLVDSTPTQFGLFEDPKRAINNERLFEAIDDAAARFGKHTVSFADCVRLGSQHAGDRGRISDRKACPLDGETARQHIGIPLLRRRL